MKQLFFGSVALLALAAAGPAVAADMPVRAPVYKASPAMIAAYSWTGFYIGVHGGGAWFDKDWFVPSTPTNIFGGCPATGCDVTVGGHRANSWLIGGQVGFNYQTGSFVWGVEAQFSWTDLHASNVNLTAPIFINNSKTDRLGTIAGRLGFAWDRALLYAKGGGAWAHDEFWVSTPTVPVAQNVTDTRWGWMIGVGVEYAFAQNWSAKVEYNHMDFGRERERVIPTAACANCFPFEYDIKQQIQLVKAGLNYKFDWGKGPVAGKGPVVARY